jgi:spore coat protein U-like protein
MRITTGLGVLTGLAFVGGPAIALTTTSPLSVQMTIQAQCVINSVDAINFGTSGVINSNHDQTSTLKVQCTNSTAYDIELNKGTTAGASIAQRKLINGSETINYNLYTDPSRTSVWGETPNTDTVGATGNGAEQTYTIFARVSAQTTPSPNTYTDTVTVTVTY